MAPAGLLEHGVGFGQKVFEGGVSAYGKLENPSEKDDARRGRPDPRRLDPRLLQSDPITETGPYRITCRRHPWQHAWLWVVENPYIAETSPVIQKPALIVYDTVEGTSRRLLEGHHSVATRNYVIQAPGRDMRIMGIATLRIPIDSIALDTRGEWLYYGAVTGDRLQAKRNTLRTPRPLVIKYQRSLEPLAVDLEFFDQKGRRTPHTESIAQSVHNSRGLVGILIHTREPQQ